MRDGAVELLQQHDAHQLVRPGGAPKASRRVGLLAQARREAVGAADDEDHRRPPVVAPAPEAFGERRAVEAFAALVEHHGDRAFSGMMLASAIDSSSMRLLGLAARGSP